MDWRPEIGQDGECTPQRVGVFHGSGAEPEERGDPKVPRGADSVLPAHPGVDRATGRGRHQGSVVRSHHRVRRSHRRPDDHSHPREILMVDEWSVRGRSQSCFRPAELPDGYSTRLHPDPHPEPCTRQLERWLLCTIPRQSWSRERVPDPKAPGKRQREPVRRSLDGRARGQIGPDEVSHPSAGPRLIPDPEQVPISRPATDS